MTPIKQLDDLKNFKTAYSLITGSTYEQALRLLIKNSPPNQPQHTLSDGSTVYRPLTLKENMEARVEDNSLFNKSLDGCTGIAYKKGTSMVKFNPISTELLTLPRDFNKLYLAIDYAQVVGEELDKSKVSKMDLWLAAMGGASAENKDLYNTYKKTLRQRTKIAKDKLMNFYTLDNRPEDELAAVYVQGGIYYPGANGSNNFGADARFLRVN